jgi:HPt (histidine-containing phosphotransfer) domain-containing protein
MQKYIRMYLDSVPQSLEKVNSALHKKDYGLLRASVHTLKTHLTYMGMAQAKSVAQKIENFSAEQKNLDELPGLVKELNALAASSIIELSDAVKSL